MKILLLVIISTLQTYAFAGQESGGGGHPCKSEFMQIYNDIKVLTNDQPNLQVKHPYLSQMLSLLDSPTNVILEIREDKIVECPNAQNPIACSRPQLNKIEIYCTSDGWASLSQEDKTKIVMHELLWWSDYNDSNNYYSNLLYVDLKPALSQLTQSTSAEIKKSAAVPFEIDLSEINRNSVPVHFLDITLYYQCSISKPDEGFKDYNYNELHVSETQFTTQNQKLSGNFSIKGNARFDAPLRNSTYTSSSCSVTLGLKYSFESFGVWRMDEIYFFGVNERSVGATVDLTETVLKNVMGEYKAEWIPLQENPSRCLLGIRKTPDGYLFPSVSTHPCPIKN